MHALIIEDEHIIAMAVEDVLKAWGFQSFDFASSAQAAVDAASQRCPDLITSDVKLDPGCGIEAVQSICSESEVPVIFITGNGTEARLRSPKHSVLDKPFSDEALTAAVSAALASSTSGLRDGRPEGGLATRAGVLGSDEDDGGAIAWRRDQQSGVTRR